MTVVLQTGTRELGPLDLARQQLDTARAELKQRRDRALDVGIRTREIRSAKVAAVTEQLYCHHRPEVNDDLERLNSLDFNPLFQSSAEWRAANEVETEAFREKKRVDDAVKRAVSSVKIAAENIRILERV